MTGPGDDKTPEEIGCLEAIESLYAYLDGEVGDPDATAVIEHHLSHCRSCCSRAEMERALTQRLRASAGQQAPASLQHRLHTLLAKFGEE
jgi:anti-sigma factor (TIGR02949 family)